MKQPTYKMARIALADCKPHADAEAYSASSEDRAALSNSINESGLLSPIAVIEEAGAEARQPENRARQPENRARPPEIGDARNHKKTYYVIDGIGRMNALIAAGVTETEAQVFDLGDLSVAEFVVCKNAMMRKVTTGTRVMAYLKCHEREVLAAAEPEKYKARPLNGRGRRVNAVSHETALNDEREVLAAAEPEKYKARPLNGRGRRVNAVSHETALNDKGWNAKEIAERIGVSKNDVLAGIELLKACAGAEARNPKNGQPENGEDGGRAGARPSQGDGEGRALSRPHYDQLDLFETAEAVLRGETPIRRWKAAAGGKVSKVGGKAAADYEAIGNRTMLSLMGLFANWQAVPMEGRAAIIDRWRMALATIPDDFKTVIELEFCENCAVLEKAKRGKRK